MLRIHRTYQLNGTLGVVYSVDGQRCSTALPKGVEGREAIAAYLGADLDLEPASAPVEAPLAIASAGLALAALGAPLAFVATLATLALAIWLSTSDATGPAGRISDATTAILPPSGDELDYAAWREGIQSAESARWTLARISEKSA